MTRAAVFLDRDGVLNNTVVRDGVSHPPADAESMIVTSRAADAVARLKAGGYLCICVTNQPDIARGTRTLDNVLAMNEKIRRLVPLDDLYYCPHDGKDACLCRKPKPGMLVAAAEKWGVSLPSSWMIGDRSTDVLAGKAAGCKTILVSSSFPKKEIISPQTKPDAIVTTLWDAVEHILDRG